jgi:hypothetical protein
MARQILGMIEGKSGVPDVLVLPTELVVRGTA